MLSSANSDDDEGGGIGGGDDGKAPAVFEKAGNLYGEGKNCEEGIFRGEGCVVSVVVAWEGGTGSLSCVEVVGWVEESAVNVRGGRSWVGMVSDAEEGDSIGGGDERRVGGESLSLVGGW